MKKKIFILLLLCILGAQSETKAADFSMKFDFGQQNETIAAHVKDSPLPVNTLAHTRGKPIKLVFSDIDGTILKFESKKKCPIVPEEIKTAVRILEQNNIPLVLVTGRSYYEAKSIYDEMGVKNNYLVALQGGEIISPEGKLIHKDKLKDEKVKKITKEILKYTKKTGINVSLYYFANGQVYTESNIPLRYNWEKTTQINSLKTTDLNNDCGKIVIFNTDTQKLKQIQTHLKKKFNNVKIDITTDSYCDITSPSATKANAIKKLSKLYGVDLSETAAFGDSENDISMLKLIKENGGAAIAVENAMPELKIYANYKTDSVNNFGFAKGVNEIIKLNKK